MSETRLPENRRVATPALSSISADLPEPTHDEPWADWKAIGRRCVHAVLTALLLATIGAASVGARYWVTHSPRFGLQQLVVTGNQRFSTEQVAALAGVGLGQNLVALDLAKARDRLESEPWIERARLARRLPGTLQIEVNERVAAAVVLLPSGAYLATPDGDLFKHLELGDAPDLPVITGIRPDDAVLDHGATAQLLRRALDLGAEIERTQLYGGRVEELAINDQGGVTAVLGRHGLRIAFGTSGYRNKVRLAQRVEADLTKRGAHPTLIFLDDDQHPDRIVVRLVSALPPAVVEVDEPTKPGGVAMAVAHPAGGNGRGSTARGHAPSGRPPTAHGRAP